LRHQVIQWHTLRELPRLDNIGSLGENCGELRLEVWQQVWEGVRGDVGGRRRGSRWWRRR
jgi:hypothetical protein